MENEQFDAFFKTYGFIRPADVYCDLETEDLSELLLESIKRAGWDSLMPVQSKAMPYMIDQCDLMVQSKTGSGKTGAFVLPLFDIIDINLNAPQAMILVPTRELAKQVYTEINLLAGDSGIKAIDVYGGVGYKKQLDAFKDGVHIVVGTPGRMLDHLMNGNLSLRKLKVLTFDEADRMLSMGFYPDMCEVQKYLPSHPINSYMFSATFPPRVMGLASQFLKKPCFLSLSSDNILVAETEHRYYTVPLMDKDRALIRIIEMENPGSGIIFCNTKAKVHYLATVLKRFGYNADEISADQSQSAREEVMTNLRERKLKFLVATDVVERGIDIPALSHVINYEIPDDAQSYVHRSGRTGRAGAAGIVISLVEGLEERDIKLLAKKFDLEIAKQELPDDEQVQKMVSERALIMLKAELRTKSLVERERLQRFVPFSKDIHNETDGKELLSMLLDKFYHQMIHNPDNQPIIMREPIEKPSYNKRSYKKRR